MSVMDNAAGNNGKDAMEKTQTALPEIVDSEADNASEQKPRIKDPSTYKNHEKVKGGTCSGARPKQSALSKKDSVARYKENLKSRRLSSGLQKDRNRYRKSARPVPELDDKVTISTQNCNEDIVLSQTFYRQKSGTVGSYNAQSQSIIKSKPQTKDDVIDKINSTSGKGKSQSGSVVKSEDLLKTLKKIKNGPNDTETAKTARENTKSETFVKDEKQSQGCFIEKEIDTEDRRKVQSRSEKKRTRGTNPSIDIEKKRNSKTNDSGVKSGSLANGQKMQNDITRNKAKAQNVYVIVPKMVLDKQAVSDYIYNRMGLPSGLEFLVVRMENVERVTECVLVSLELSSSKKAAAAVHLLNKSNRNNENKVHCFYNKRQALGRHVSESEDRKVKIGKALEDMLKIAEKSMKRHEEKIDDHVAMIKTIDDQLRGKRGVHINAFEMIVNEKAALEDKLEELRLQLGEFMEYMCSLRSKLGELVNNQKYYQDLQEVKTALDVECHRLKNALPIYARRTDILDVVKKHKVSIVLGETGSGKSTQMIQYLYQAGLAEEGFIACTQPRKIAAVSLAKHVAQEMSSNVGQVVGYHVGMQSRKSELTKMLFMTDHILLNECLKDRSLSKYSCIVMDEAHERSIFTDLLLGLIKKCLETRNDLKVIITSATIDPDIFVNFFGGNDVCPVLKVSGRTFPVEVVWDFDELSDAPFPNNYEAKALQRAIEIHKNTSVYDGDILVFLTSAVETEKCVEKFICAVGEGDCMCLPLHGRLRAEEQQLVFTKPAKGKRKVVFATNSAETSITIDGIKFVIDTGVVKEMRFDAKKSMSSLDTVPISQSSANQRKGRAGRTTSGMCYRLYSQTDYKNMIKTAFPEILRIQMAQALLKLLELEVDPLTFDYVQAPCTSAMKLAMDNLTDIGAVNSNGQITESGKWISKLPLEPRLAMMIKHGIDLKVHSEAIVVASCCSQSGIFYRAGSLEDKRDADMKKLKFCHDGGDLLTMLSVFREWEKVPEKKKGQWCKDNSINGKSMKCVREMMNEVFTVLRKETNIKLKHVFADPLKSDEIVQTLIFECMKGNLAYYLGHENAGYLVLSRQQRVQVHPSSALLSLGSESQWVVYNRLIRTSADFITDVTPVDISKVKEAVSKKQIQVDMTTLFKLRVVKAGSFSVGRHVFWKFVGTQHRNRRLIEDEIRSVCNDTTVIVEAKKQRGEILLYCVPDYCEVAADMLSENIKPLPQQLINERLELPILNRKGENTGTRAVLGVGGEVVTILRPSQYRSLNIKEKMFSKYSVSEEDLRERLSCYGPVEEIWQTTGKKNANSIYWGRATFTNEIDAVEAVNDVNEDDQCNFILDPITYRVRELFTQKGFVMKISWCRRPGKGHCYVYLKEEEDYTTLLLKGSFKIGDRNALVQRAKRSSHSLTGKVEIFVKGLLPYVNEGDVIDGIKDALDIHEETEEDRFRVIIPRENIVWTSNEVREAKSGLATTLSKFANTDSFDVHVVGFRASTADIVAYVSFHDLETAEGVWRKIQEDNIFVDKYVCPLSADMEFKSNVHVNKFIFSFVEDDLTRLLRHYEGSRSTSVHITTLKSGHFSVDIVSTKLPNLARAKVKIDEVIGGLVLECGETKNLHLLFGREGRVKLGHIERSTKTLIRSDGRQLKITIQGKLENRENALKLIHQEIDKCLQTKEQEIRLKGDENPPGLMKSLFLKYGVKFAILKAECGLSNININMRFHEICLKGTEDALTSALEKIKEEREKLAVENIREDSDLPECPVCLCAIEDSELVRLEKCAHAYCNPCLIQQVLTAVKDADLPIKCAHEKCEEPMVIRDINMQLKNGTIKRSDISKAALNAYVSKNNEEFKFCITPDCQMVYQVSDSGTEFVCDLCYKHICTSCHLEYHKGMTCAMYASAKKDGDSVLKWIKENPSKRKKCPKCDMGIEKIEGCDHMTCRCGTHICWKCMEYFKTGQDCYGHLARAHGSFV